jgi:AhpD family alkylhydroperoxidase
MTMARIEISKLAPEAYRSMAGLERFLRGSGLPDSTLELVRLRASQINGCAFCVHMHSRDAKNAGESDERLWSVAAWRDAPYYTEAERAALALTEAATRLGDRPDPVPDDVWAAAAEHYGEEDLAALVVAIATINAWNRISVTTRMAPPSLQ